MGLEKATIDILKTGEPKRLRVMFNPAEYSIERGNSYKSTSIPGLGGPLIQFINGEARTLTMELFIDDYSDTPTAGTEGVQQMLDDFNTLLDVDRDLHAPPLARFVWGKLSFKAVVEKISTKITLFRSDGTPARATLNVSFKEYKTLPERITDPRLQSADKTKRRVLVGEEMVWALACREFGSPLLWRTIAQANDLDDPRDVGAGDWLIVPPLENRDESR
jgi:nucleoid-associated protein YgaU